MRWFIIIPVLYLASCSDLPPGPVGVGVQLSLEDVSCSEAWLRVQVSSPGSPLSLLRDGNAVRTFSLVVPDTVVMDEGLASGRSYTYQIRRMGGGLAAVVEASEPVSVRTLDTTSHQFSFETFQLGDGSSSELYDVTIINDTLAYAVGAIYLRDSLGNWDPNAYNLVKWNGTTWSLLRIQFYTICGQSGTTPYPASSVLAFGGNDLWIAMDGSQVARWNGSAQTATMCLPVSFSIKKLWGESPNSVYAVGDGGNILHYANGTWQKLESGTTLDFRDVYGSRNPRTGEVEILAVASSSGGFERRILQLSPTLSIVPESGLVPYSRLGGVWLRAGTVYFVVGDGVYSRHDINTKSPWEHYAGVTQFYTPSVRGNGINDIVVTGVYGELLHFNGFSWFSFRTSLGVPSAVLGSVALKGNLVLVVGFDGSRGLAVVGRR
jgi:hypothetical protein